MSYCKKTVTIILASFLMLCVSNNAHAAGSSSLKIASWNMWDFSGDPDGAWKTNSDGSKCTDYVCQGYADVLISGNYDLIFVQEIRTKVSSNGDVTYPAFDDLCQNYLASKYRCYALPVSSYNGSVSKDAYGIIYAQGSDNKEYITAGTHVSGMKGSPNQIDAKITTLNGSEIKITFLNNHILSNIANSYQELVSLQNYVSSLNTDHVIVLGDLNMGAKYILDTRQKRKTIFPEQEWNWLITDNQFTSFAGVTALESYNEDNPGNALDRFIAHTSLRGFYSTDPEDSINVGLIDKVPYDIYSNVNATPTLKIPANTFFKDVIWNGQQPESPAFGGSEFGGSVFGLSDHKLIWFNLLFGGVNADNILYYNQTYNSAQCTDTGHAVEPVIITGSGFPPKIDYNITAYIVKRSFHPNEPLAEGFNLVNAMNSVFTVPVRTNDLGELERDSVVDSEIKWLSAWESGHFNVVVDMDNDGRYDSGIDIIDKGDGYSFQMMSCNTNSLASRKISATISSSQFPL